MPPAQLPEAPPLEGQASARSLPTDAEGQVVIDPHPATKAARPAVQHGHMLLRSDMLRVGEEGIGVTVALPQKEMQSPEGSPTFNKHSEQ
eukprot:SM000167S02934  [mRNA]  locus=s167:52939:53527:+ [translate_table: standard]